MAATHGRTTTTRYAPRSHPTVTTARSVTDATPWQTRHDHGSRSVCSQASTTPRTRRDNTMTDDLMRHAPHCDRPGTTTTHGHSVDVTRCDGCGCLSTVRHHVTVNEQTDER